MCGAAVAMLAASKSQTDEKKRGLLQMSAGLLATSGAVFMVAAVIGAVTA
jgi:hypothetical protein